jgi:hypothetical protein
MVISHRHKFIFIKNRKVGPTSTEVAPQKILGPDDILTPDSIWAATETSCFPRREIIADGTCRSARSRKPRP